MDNHSLDRLLVQRGIFEKWHHKTFEEFKGDKEALKLVRDYLDKYSENKKNGLGGFLWGQNGGGKTYLLNTLLKTLFIERKKEVSLISFQSIIANYTKNWKGEGDWAKLQSVEVLAIEELGKEFRASSISQDLVVAATDALLRYRVQRLKPTWITTNLKPAELYDIYGPSISSLMKESMILIEVKGEDYRNNIHKEVNKHLKTEEKPQKKEGGFNF